MSLHCTATHYSHSRYCLVRRHAVAFALVVLMKCVGMPAVAAANPVLVVDATSGSIVHQEGADQRWYPASLAKLMTLYLVFEALDQGRLALNTPLPVSSAAAAQPAVRLGLRQGATLTVAQAVEALATVSSNDAAVVLAEALAGTEAQFAVKMTARAAGLGMVDTHYANASGLPNDAQVTTARDQAILARRLLTDFPQHYALFATRSTRYQGRTLHTHNGLLGRYPGADGLKTGFTCAAGYNIVASAVRDGRRLIAVVLGANSRAARDAQVSRLLDAGFAAPMSVAQTAEALEERPEGMLAAVQGAVGRSGCEQGGPAGRMHTRVVWPIESWGVLLGVYSDRGEAQRTINRAKAQLGRSQKMGRPLLLEREMENGTSWKALLIGYRHDNVGAVCLRLWAKGLDCVAQAPVVLNLPGYAKR